MQPLPSGRFSVTPDSLPRLPVLCAGSHVCVEGAGGQCWVCSRCYDTGPTQTEARATDTLGLVTPEGVEILISLQSPLQARDLTPRATPPTTSSAPPPAGARPGAVGMAVSQQAQPLNEPLRSQRGDRGHRQSDHSELHAQRPEDPSQVRWGEQCPPQIHVLPKASKHDLFRKWGLCRCNESR